MPYLSEMSNATKMIEKTGTGRLWLLCLMVAVLAAAIYLPTLRYGYTLMDDYGLIVENFSQISDIGNIANVFITDAFGSNGALYRPLLTVSFMVDALYGGKAAWSYHLTNILMHVVSCCLLFYLLISLDYSGKASFIAASIFSIHPVLVQAVAWIPGRNDILLTIWVLGACISWVRYLDDRKSRWLALHFLSGILAVFTKETAALLPLVLLLSTRLSRRMVPAKTYILLVAGWLTIGLLWLYLKLVIITGAGEMAVIGLADLARGLLGYIGKIIIPINFAAIPVPKDTGMVTGLIGAGILAAGILYGIRNKRKFLLGACWFIIFLTPNIFTSTDYANFMEHRLYLPMVGFIIMIMELSLWQAVSKKSGLSYVFYLIVMILLGARTAIHSSDFKDGKSFWDYAVKTSPSLYYVHDMRGRLYLQGGEIDKAEESFLTAISLKKEYHHGYNNLGVAYLSQGRYGEEENSFRSALLLSPSYIDARMNIGSLYLQLGSLDSAKASFVKLLEYDPGNHQALNDLGIVYYRMNLPDSAVICLNRALELDPGNRSYQINLRAVKRSAGNDAR